MNKMNTKRIAASLTKTMKQVARAAASMTVEQRETLLAKLMQEFSFTPGASLVTSQEVTVLPQELSLRPSSLVQAALYSPEFQTLRVTLAGNRSYVYQNVPASIVEGLTNAESVGAYFNQNVRNTFHWAEV